MIYFSVLLASFCVSQVRKRVDIFSDSSLKLDLLPFRKLTIILYNENNQIGAPNRCQSYSHHPKCGISHKITQLKIGLNSNNMRNIWKVWHRSNPRKNIQLQIIQKLQFLSFLSTYNHICHSIIVCHIE